MNYRGLDEPMGLDSPGHFWVKSCFEHRKFVGVKFELGLEKLEILSAPLPSAVRLCSLVGGMH